MYVHLMQEKSVEGLSLKCSCREESLHQVIELGSNMDLKGILCWKFFL